MLGCQLICLFSWGPACAHTLGINARLRLVCRGVDLGLGVGHQRGTPAVAGSE